MTMFLATVFSICFLIGKLSTAPTPPTPPSTRSSAAVSSLPNNIIRHLEDLHRKLQTVLNTNKFEKCRKVEIQEIKFGKNCTQGFYTNMFCQAHNVLHQTQCGKEVAKVIPSSLRGNQTNCDPSGTRDKGITLAEFCLNLNITVERMYREC